MPVGAVVPEDDYDFEYEYRVIDFTVKKDEVVTLPDGWSVTKVIGASKAAMDEGTWNFTVLIERESMVTNE